jgi:hypothetical protein
MLIPNGKMTVSDAEFTAMLEHDGRQVAKITEQRARIAELEGLLREVCPGIRDILWCALGWNDHNFTERDLLDKATRAAKSMGLDRFNGVDAVNFWMARVDKALGSITSGEGNAT